MYTKQQELLVRQGHVYSVDRKNWTCKVKYDDGTPEESVAIAPFYLNSHGSGIFYVPEVNAAVIVAYVGERKFLLGCTYPDVTENSKKEIENVTEEKELEPDHSAKRPALSPGDLCMTTKGGGFLIMRSSGVIEVGASQVARRFYIPLTNFVRDICSFYDLTTAGGNLSFTNRPGDPTHGTITTKVKIDPDNPDAAPVDKKFNKTPVEFNLNIKEFVEDPEPIIQLEMGRITNKDGNSAPLYGSNASNNYDKDVLVRFSVNKKFNIWIDRFGTIVSNFTGTVSQQYQKNYNLGTKGNLTIGSGGRLNRRSGGETIDVKGTYKLTVKNNAEETYNSDRAISVSGKKTEIVDGRRETSCTAETDLVKGSSKKEILADHDLTVAGNLTITAGEETREVFTKGYSADIPTGGYSVLCTQGDVKLTSVVGKCQIGFFEVSEVVCNAAKATLKYIAGGEVIVNASGAGMQTLSGEVSLDQAGNVTLGPTAGLAAPVVTAGPTGSHPVCFVTGLPIRGCVEVTARSNKPGSITGLPNTFLSV